MKQYGYPPAPDQCAEAPVPKSLKEKADTQMLTPVVSSGMVPGALNRPLTNQAIVRQLYKEYAEDLTVGPISVTVGGRTFYIGEKGWCVV